MKLRIHVSGKDGESLFCRILVAAAGADRKDAEPGPEPVYCGGSYERRLAEGAYTVEVTRGRLYQKYRQDIKAGEKDLTLEVRLEELVDTQSMGLYSFDAHSHVSRDEKLETGNLVSASAVMRGEGFNLFFAGSPYDHEVHLQYLRRKFTDTLPYREKYADVLRRVRGADFILDIGNEIVKCRYGHAFLMNYEQRPPFSKYYDEAYDRWLFDRTGPEPPYALPYPYEALLTEKRRNSVAVAAHPTSWWWHTDGKFIPNIAASLGFDILAGAVDAMVVMGYQGDRPSYQKLWFEILRNGYFLPGVAETDASFDRPPQKFLEFKTYAVARELSIDSVCEAVRRGRCIVSSGPVVLMKVGGRIPGSVLNYEKGDRFSIEIDAFRCREAALSKLQIILDGTLYKEYAVGGGRVSVTDLVEAARDGFVLVKCYDRAGNLAMTNPVYFRNTPFLNIGYRARVTVRAMRKGAPAGGSYWLDGRPGKTRFAGPFSLKMPPASALCVEVAGLTKTVKLFELPALQRIFSRLYSGRFNRAGNWQPGEVPPEEFGIGKIREILDHAEIDLDF